MIQICWYLFFIKLKTSIYAIFLILKACSEVKIVNEMHNAYKFKYKLHEKTTNHKFKNKYKRI